MSACIKAWVKYFVNEKGSPVPFKRNLAKIITYGM